MKYRPICLINVIATTSERLIMERLKVEVNDKLSEFRKNRSIKDVIKFVSKVVEKEEKGL